MFSRFFKELVAYVSGSIWMVPSGINGLTISKAKRNNEWYQFFHKFVNTYSNLIHFSQIWIEYNHVWI